MRHPGKKIVAGVLVSLGGLTLVVVVGLWWALGTTQGAQWVLSRALSVIGEDVTIAQVEGRLWGPFVLHDLHYQSESVSVQIDQVHMRWQLAKLVSMELEVDHARLVNSRILIHEKTEEPDQPAGRDKSKGLPDINLPIDIAVHQLTLDRILIEQEGKPDSFLIEKIVMEDLLLVDSLGVKTLIIESPLGDLALGGTILPTGAYAIDMEIDWTLRPEGMAPLEGGGRIYGDLDSIIVSQTLRAPVKASLNASVYDVDGQRFVDAELDAPDFRLSQLKEDLPSYSLRIRSRLQGRPDSIRVTADAGADLGEFGRWKSDVSLDLYGREALLRKLTLSSLDGSTVVRAKGRLRPAESSPEFELDISWEDFAWPITGTEKIILSDVGSLHASGFVNDYHLLGEADLETPDQDLGFWQFGLSGTLDNAAIDSLESRFLGGSIVASGSVSWDPSLEWDMDLRGFDIKTDSLSENLPGEIDFRLRSRGQVQNEILNASAQLDQLQGYVLGELLYGELYLTIEGDHITVNHSQFSLGPIDLLAQGDLLSPWDATWQLSVADFGALNSDWQGRLKASGELTGTDSIPNFTLELNADSLSIQGIETERLQISADVIPTPSGHLHFLMESVGIELPGGLDLDSLLIQSSGEAGNTEMTLEAHSDSAVLAMNVRGSLDEKSWRGTIRKLDLRSEHLEDWRLANEVPIYLSADSARISDFVWATEKSRLSFRGQWRSKGRWDAEFSLQDQPLDALGLLLPNNWGIRGIINADGEVRGDTTGLVSADLNARADNGFFLFANQGRSDSLRYESFAAHVKTDPERIVGEMSFTSRNLGSAKGDLSIELASTDPSGQDQAISGTFHYQIEDLSPFARAMVLVDRLSGSIEVNARLEGNLNDPIITGDAALTGGGALLPRLGLELENIVFDARSDSRGDWTIDGEVTSGDGKLEFDAVAKGDNIENRQIEFSVEGSNFSVLNTMNSKILISPELKLTIDSTRVNLTGTILVPEADIRVPKIDFGKTVTVSEDVRIVGEEFDTTSTLRAVHASVRLELGDNVRFDGFDLRARLAGGIAVTERPGQTTRASGELSIADGTYTGFGQMLDIERGTLGFGGAIDNPTLDILATRLNQDRTVKAGFLVTGTLRAPVVDTYSDPPMSQPNVLSYILSGKPLDDAAAGEAQLAQQTATAIGLQAGSAYTQQVGRSLGLDEARLESRGAMNETALMLGTHLSPHIYVNYGIGLFDSGNIFRVKYFLSKHFTVQGETEQQQSGADLIYGFEK